VLLWVVPTLSFPFSSLHPIHQLSLTVPYLMHIVSLFPFHVALSLVCTIGRGGTTLCTLVYDLLLVGLWTPPVASLPPLLTAAGGGRDNDGPLLSPALPTLLLFECVLVHMTPTVSNALIQWTTLLRVVPQGGTRWCHVQDVQVERCIWMCHVEGVLRSCLSAFLSDRF